MKKLETIMLVTFLFYSNQHSKRNKKLMAGFLSKLIAQELLHSTKNKDTGIAAQRFELK